jgi:hypothetical protein
VDSRGEQHFVVRADEKLTAFVELELAIRTGRLEQMVGASFIGRAA